MRIVALMCIYNAQGLIYNSLTAVAPAVDEIRIYDGRYVEYPCTCGRDHDNSCDHTVEEVEQFERDYDGHPPVTYIKVPAMSEIEKRNAMFRGAEGDLAFVIDDDELLIGKPDPLRTFAEKEDKFAYIDFLFPDAGHGTGAVIPLARLFRVQKNIRYEKAYFRLVDDDGLVVDMKADNVRIPDGIRTRNRYYLPPTTFITSLYKYRGRGRNEAAIAYNNRIGPRDWY